LHGVRDTSWIRTKQRITRSSVRSVIYNYTFL
jgi:hypothetical protein